MNGRRQARPGGSNRRRMPLKTAFCTHFYFYLLFKRISNVTDAIHHDTFDLNELRLCEIESEITTVFDED